MKKSDVFISHSSDDSKLAYAICHYLEERDIRCWIAPRDVQTGTEYAESIINGIKECRIMVVVFNKNSNASLFVKNEVERAFNYRLIIIPFRVDDTMPSATLELFLGSVHWLDAINGRAEDYFELLHQNCARVLGTEPKLVGSSNNKSTTPTTSIPTGNLLLPNASATLILGISSLIGMCIGPILGIIGLMISNTSTKLIEKNPSGYNYRDVKNLNAGRICCIIGISFWGLMDIIWIIAYIASM